MPNSLNCIMLVDDDDDDNFIHERAIKKNNPNNTVLSISSAIDALAYLKSKKDPRTELIFLDINMPSMNGWEFLQEYSQLDSVIQKHAIIFILTTSGNPDDVAKAKSWNFVSDLITKPLTREKMHSITNEYF